MPSAHELLAADRRHLWHPFTQQLSWCEEDDAPLVIASAQGTNLIDTEGNVYIDGVSSLWCNVHGHRHPAIDAAIVDQLGRVAHSTMLGLTHPPAIQLAEELVAVAPAGLRRVFLSESGSTAVEIALKMAFQWWAQRGEPRQGFVCLENAYHGDTIGAVSVGGIDLFHGLYRPLLFESWRAGATDPADLERLLRVHAGEVAAVIVEPLVQGAAGMLMQPPGYLREVRELCREHGVLLICDEVATGFGRTGTMFACEQESVTPDLLCLGKGLTGGYLPLAATLTTEEVYDGFLGEPEQLRTFFHGHTYTGNPLACAAALATLETFRQEQTLKRLGPKIALLQRRLEEQMQPLAGVAEVRQRGMMVGIELCPAPASARLGHRVTLAARRRGAIVRPLGDVVVLMPALAMSESDLERLVAITAEAVEEVASPVAGVGPS